MAGALGPIDPAPGQAPDAACVHGLLWRIMVPRPCPATETPP